MPDLRPGNLTEALTDYTEFADSMAETIEQELDDQLFRMRIQKSLGQLEAPGRIKDVRRDLARIKTILREKAK